MTISLWEKTSYIAKFDQSFEKFMSFYSSLLRRCRGLSDHQPFFVRSATTIAKVGSAPWPRMNKTPNKKLRPCPWIFCPKSQKGKMADLNGTSQKGGAAKAPPLLDLTIDNLTENVARINSQVEDTRMRFLITELVKASHGRNWVNGNATVGANFILDFVRRTQLQRYTIWECKVHRLTKTL